jgi:hypothetical protein
MKDLLEAYPKPKAYTTTIATLLKEWSTSNLWPTIELETQEYYPLVKENRLFLETRQRID